LRRITNRCEAKQWPKLREIENRIPEEMEARLITAVKELVSYLMSL
jgi:hypothetical protein